jgi:ABC-type polysaccharide/polyol phosphate transport system ATPase subunit
MIVNILSLENVTLDIPVFDANRSFRKSLKQFCTGGNVQQDASQKSVCVRALDNISFQLNKGDRVGLIGHNGAGKTTLLRVLAGIYKPLCGKIQCNGRVTSLLNSMIGIDYNETGLENIRTFGMYLGMSKQELQQKEQEIIDFSELGDFIKLPVRIYSTGMQLRLTFSVITALEPQILLMDEAMGVGDANFADKAKKRLEQFYQKLDVLVIATHSNALIKQLCNKAMLLEHGKVLAFGEVNEVLDFYAKSLIAA